MEGRVLFSPSIELPSPRRKSCLLRDDGVLSPPRNLMESAHRRSISSNTCSVERHSVKTDEKNSLENGDMGRDLNAFLKQQRVRVNKVLDGEERGEAKIVLSGTSNSESFLC